MGWDPLILSSERELFESNLRSEGYRNFQITERNSDNQLTRAGMRSEYVAVSFIEPFQGNETALGYDVHSDKLRHEALDKARDTGEIAVTAPIRLVQDKGDQFGFLAFLAIYRNGTPHQTLEERRKNLTGYVVAVFRGRDVITAALKDLKHKGLPYRLTDQSAPEAEQLIYASDQKKFKSITLQEKGLFGKDLSPVSQGNRA